MDNCNIGTTIRKNLSFLWSSINQQPTEIFLGAIVGWTAFWIPFIMEREAVVYVLADLASVFMLWNFAANFQWLLNFLTPPIADLFLGTTVGWFVGWSLFQLRKIPIMYPVVMVIAILLSTFLIWYLGDFIWEKIKELIIFLITVFLGVCAILLSVLILFGKVVLISLVVMAVVALVSLVMVFGLDKIKSMISNAIFDKLWNFFIFSIGTFILSGFVVWGPTLMSLLFGKSFLFYLASVAVALLNMTNMNIIGPGSREEIELDGLPPPSPETLPESRQQEVDGQFASPPGSSLERNNEITQGTGHIQDENRSIREQPPTAPSTCQLVPVRTEQEQPPLPVANPTGPGHMKPRLDQIDRQDLQSVDDHATRLSKYNHPSFKELINDLIFSKNIDDESEKVRVIFIWLASKNLKEMILDNVEKGSPEEIFLELKAGKTTYAKVFDTMCNYAKLQSTIINGYAKGENYTPGMKFNPATDKHTWNAVYINGTWGLVDANWGARSVLQKRGNFKYQLNEHFFLPDPHHFICEHFPENDQWQLLDRPVTLVEFENMPHTKPDFFKYGLEFVSHDTVIIYGQGEINVRLRYPANKVALNFNFRLKLESSEEEEYKGTKLIRYGMQESIEGIVSFRFRLPAKGSYVLIIYASEKKDNVCDQVCEYKMVQEEVSVTEPPPFPPCASLNWGPSTYFYRYGLDTYQKTAKILTKDGKAELQIIIPRQMHFRTKLKHNDRNDADLEGYVTHRIVENTVYFNITVPSRGEYGLEIHANDPATEGSTIYRVAQYLVDCNEDVKTVLLPKLPSGYLGAKPKFNDYGLNTLSHHIPVIHLEANTVEIQFSVTQEVRVKANLIEVESDRETPEFVFIQTKDSVVSFIVNCPSVGFYKLQLYATPIHNPSQLLTGVYNYLINCQRKTDNVFPFPIQYTKWTEGCYMWEPLIVHKEIEKPTVNFHVKIPKAKAVAVEVNQKWTQLQSLMPEIWQGEVNLAPYYGEGVKVTLNAFFGGDNTSYSTLLEYLI